MDINRFKKEVNQIISSYNDIKKELKDKYLEILNNEINILIEMINDAKTEEEKKNLLDNYNKLINLRNRLINI